MSQSPVNEEDVDIECPLCLEILDYIDRGFKPCPCGYQVQKLFYLIQQFNFKSYVLFASTK